MDANGTSPSGEDDLPLGVDGIYERLMTQVPEIKAGLDEIEARRELLTRAHQQRMAELDTQKKKLTGLLRVLGQEPPKPIKRQASSVAQGTRPPVGARILIQMIDGILAQGNDAFTVLGIHNFVNADWSEPHSYQAMKYLRRVEFIRKSGKEGDRPGGRDMFKILDVEIGERLKAVADEQLPVDTGKPSAYEEPSPSSILRTVEAIKTMEQPSFTTLEVNERLGLKSARSTYSVFRWLRDHSVLKEAGQKPGDNGRHPQQKYSLDNEDPVKELLNAAS